MRPYVTFIIPVRHQSNSKDWSSLKVNLAQTITSISAQTNKNWHAVIVANQGADLPDLPPIEVPAPINTTPLINSPVSVGQSTTGGSTPIVNRDPINNSVGDPISNILQATNLDQAVAGADTAGMVKPSTQGWMIFGIAWYVWLVILVGMFIGGRLVLSSINRRKANSLT